MNKKANVEQLKAVEEKKDYNIILSLYDYSVEGKDTSEVEYKDIMGYQISGEWVAVSMKDGTTHAFPKDTISYIKHYIAV